MSELQFEINLKGDVVDFLAFLLGVNRKHPRFSQRQGSRSVINGLYFFHVEGQE